MCFAVALHSPPLIRTHFTGGTLICRSSRFSTRLIICQETLTHSLTLGVVPVTFLVSMSHRENTEQPPMISRSFLVCCFFRLPAASPVRSSSLSKGLDVYLHILKEETPTRYLHDNEAGEATDSEKGLLAMKKGDIRGATCGRHTQERVYERKFRPFCFSWSWWPTDVEEF